MAGPDLACPAEMTPADDLDWECPECDGDAIGGGCVCDLGDDEDLRDTSCPAGTTRRVAVGRVRPLRVPMRARRHQLVELGAVTRLIS